MKFGRNVPYAYVILLRWHPPTARRSPLCSSVRRLSGKPPTACDDIGSLYNTLLQYIRILVICLFAHSFYIVSLTWNIQLYSIWWYWLLKIVSRCRRTLRGEVHSAAGWGIGGSVIAADCGNGLSLLALRHLVSLPVSMPLWIVNRC